MLCVYNHFSLNKIFIGFPQCPQQSNSERKSLCSNPLHTESELFNLELMKKSFFVKIILRLVGLNKLDFYEFIN